MKNSYLLLKKSYQSSKDHNECEPHHRRDLCNTLINVKGLASCCNSRGPQLEKGHKIAITFPTTIILYAINQLTSLESPCLSYWDPKWTSTFSVQNSTLPSARVSQRDLLSLLGGYVCTYHVAVPSSMMDAYWVMWMGKQSFVIQGHTLQLHPKHIFIIWPLYFVHWVNELFWQFILKEADCHHIL